MNQYNETDRIQGCKSPTIGNWGKFLDGKGEKMEGRKTGVRKGKWKERKDNREEKGVKRKSRRRRMKERNIKGTIIDPKFLNTPSGM